MFDLISTILAWLYSIVPSFGGAIMLLTLAVMLITTPLTLSGTKSMIKMQRLQPELKRIQDKFKDDREEMNAKVMAFYQANGINPVGGCLPLFIQMPVFFVLYRIIQGLTRRVSDIGASSGLGAGLANGGAADSTSLEALREQGIGRNFNPEYLDKGSRLYEDLIVRDEMPFLGVFDLATTASSIITSNFLKGIPYLILILVVGALGFVQQRQIQGRQKDGVVNPQQQMIMKFMPFFLPVISFSLQAALVLYFLVSNLYRILQQGYITRTLYGDNQDGEIDVVYPEGTEPGAKKKKKAKAEGGEAKKTAAKKSAAKEELRGTESGGSGKSGRISGPSTTAEPAGAADGNGLGGLFGRKKDKQDTDSASRAASKKSKSSDTSDSENRGGSGRTTPKGTVAPRPRKKKR